MRCSSGYVLIDRWKSCTEAFKHIMSQKVASVFPVSIALVLTPLQLPLCCVCFQLTAPDGKEGTKISPLYRDHTRKPGYPCAAQEIEQNCFGLIVRVMTQHHPIGFDCRQSRVSGLTRKALNAVFRFGRHGESNDIAGNERRCANFQAVLSPSISVLAQSMMEMNNPQNQITVLSVLQKQI